MCDDAVSEFLLFAKFHSNQPKVIYLQPLLYIKFNFSDYFCHFCACEDADVVLESGRDL